MQDGAILGVPDTELLGCLPEQRLDGEGVRERHHRALGPPGADALGDLDQLVGIAGAQRRPRDRLGFRPVPVQDDRLRVVEAGEDVDPARRPEDPGLPRRGIPQGGRQRGRPAVAVVEQESGLRVRSGVPSSIWAKETT